MSALADAGARRARRIRAFLAEAGWGGARRIPLASDASFRRYERLLGGPRPALLMDAAPPQEDVGAYARLARHLRALGLSAPAVFAEDIEAGLLVIEDLGEETYTRRLAGGADERQLYALAVDVLVALHRRPAQDTVPDWLAPYDDERLLAEACLLTDWFLPAALGRATAAGVRAAYRDAWLAVLEAVRAAPRTLVLRDYHVDNLMWLEGRSGLARCGLLDFQDAVAGAPAYDLMSLLEDARRDIPEPLVAAMRARYEAAMPGLDRAAFAEAYAVLAAQRHAKVIGIFTRLAKRDGKPNYLVHIPRVWRLLERALAHPALAPVAAWFSAEVPRGARRAPAAEGISA